MRDLPLTLLRALAAVYETGGIRPAGRMLGIQHSAVSRCMRDLEAWLGTPVLQKTPGRRSLTFTAEGEALAKVALSALGQLELAVQTVREGTRPNSVSVATTPSFAMRWLLPRLPLLAERHPKIEVSIIVDQARKTPAESGADLSIRMGGTPDDHELSVPFMDEVVFPVMSPRFWEEAGRPETPEALIGLTLLHDRDPSTSWVTWRKRFGPATLNVRYGPRFTSSDLVLRAAEQHQGVALARGVLAAQSLENCLLLRPFPDCQIDLPGNYQLITSPGSGSRSAVKAVSAWLLSDVNQAICSVGAEPLAGY